MPPLTLHITIARDVADRLRLPALEDERGSLYMGSTAPDIRVITRWERARTHFFDLNNFGEQSGPAGFLAAHEGLAEPSCLPPSTAAFVAGYLTHLVMDETWINSVYRPHFGERSPMAGALRANVMDRALQFSLDSERRRDSELIAHVLDAVARFDLDCEIGVIDADSLRRWHSVVRDMMSQAPDWERFRTGARRHLQLANGGSDDEFDELVRSLPDLVDETVRYLTAERLDAFMEESRDRALAGVKEYFRCE